MVHVNRLPKRMIIVGKPYKVVYTKDMVSTDQAKRAPYWGMCDHQSATMTIFQGVGEESRTVEEILDTLIHESIHAILQGCDSLRHCIRRSHMEEFVGEFAAIVVDTLMRNGLIEVPVFKVVGLEHASKKRRKT